MVTPLIKGVSPGIAQCGSTGRSARVAPRSKVTFTPHPRTTRSNPWFRNHALRLQHRQTGNENGDLPGRHGPPCVETPTTLTGSNFSGTPLVKGVSTLSLTQWGSARGSARVSRRGNVTVRGHPSRIGSHPRFMDIPTSLQLRRTGDENNCPLGRSCSTLYVNPEPSQ